MQLRETFEETLGAVLASLGIEEGAQAARGRTQRSSEQGHGDDQSAVAMALRARLEAAPAEIARRIADGLGAHGLPGTVTTSGHGFVNVRWSDDALNEAITAPAPQGAPERVVIDYSHPNIAKPMHAGHLRSTVIGDALARMHAQAGNTVLRQNHIGDWGSQFGMLIAQMHDEDGPGDGGLADGEALYRRAKARWSADPAFAERARAATRALQDGDATARAAWRRWTDASHAHLDAIYARLDVTLTRADIRAESAYNDALEDLAARLVACGLAGEEAGALMAYPEGFTDRDGAPARAVVRKSDGAWTYLATDLAALEHRSHALEADRVLYVVDARQAEHLAQVFTLARAAGLARPETALEHIAFGIMTDAKGRAFKSRDGGTVALETLIDEAVEAAKTALAEREAAPDAVKAQAIGVGALKYADLAKDRTASYRYDAARMSALDGNTALYLQYTRARLARLAGKARTAEITPALGTSTGEERALALALARWGESLGEALAKSRPHIACEALYRIARAGATFYEHCPVLGEGAANTAHRAALAEQGARVLTQGLEMLGIRALEVV